MLNNWQQALVRLTSITREAHIKIRKKIVEETKNLAEDELAKAGESLNRGRKTADEKINQFNSTIDNTKQEVDGAVNATKKAANDAINQGVKAAEQAFDDQVKHVEKVK